MCYIVCMVIVYRHMRKNNKPVRSEHITSGQIFKKKVLFGWSEETVLINNRRCTPILGARGAPDPLHPPPPGYRPGDYLYIASLSFCIQLTSNQCLPNL